MWREFGDSKVDMKVCGLLYVSVMEFGVLVDEYGSPLHAWSALRACLMG